MNKLCTRCEIEKPLSAFSNAGGGKLKRWCKSCFAEWCRDNRKLPEVRDRINRAKRERYRASPEQNRKWDLKAHFGITIDVYDKMLHEQNGVCAVCQAECITGRRLAVDHDHVTGEIRGLLCTNCNQGLGKFKDSVKLLQRAADYLEKK